MLASLFPPPAVPSAPQQGPDAARRVAQVLNGYQSAAERRAQGETVPEKKERLSEADVNAYLQEQVDQQPELGLKSLRVRFVAPDYLAVSATIDLDALKQRGDLGDGMWGRLVSGQQQVEVEGFLRSERGEGRFEMEKAYLGGLRIPVFVVERILNLVQSSRGTHIDLSAPHPLPYGLKQVVVSAGSVLLRG